MVVILAMCGAGSGEERKGRPEVLKLGRAGAAGQARG
jgi:hypothetical protein